MQLATIFSAVTAFALWALLVLAPTELKLSLLEPLFWAGAGAALDHAHHHRLLRFVRYAATTMLLLRLYVVVAVLGFVALVAVKPFFLSALVACLDFFSLALVACRDTFSSATTTGHSLFCTALDACTEYLVLWTPCRLSVLDLLWIGACLSGLDFLLDAGVLYVMFDGLRHCCFVLAWSSECCFAGSGAGRYPGVVRLCARTKSTG
jgi:hypothetical protein